ncbi:uncharacterized protein LOC123674771 [Harmonia axyridis]|uniref:uncharacterized protein LOC123674771 n=1 Tax=Harmonia axyridis TaxID=115357 RepID=UPI001E277675|nr:uncharacterized protein LOC123674771 [Harmonia axyridis]
MLNVSYQTCVTYKCPIHQEKIFINRSVNAIFRPAMFFRFALLLICVTFASSSLEKKFHVKCLSETKVSLREVREANFTNVRSLSDPLLYYIKCVEIKENYIQENGKVLEKRYREKLNSETERIVRCLKELPQVYDSKEIRLFIQCFD